MAKKPTKNRRPRWTKRQLDLIFENSKGKCRLCGKRHRRNDYPKTWNVDHIFPKSMKGNDDPANLAVSCVRCNRGKSDTATIYDAMEVLGNSIGGTMMGGNPRRKDWL